MKSAAQLTAAVAVRKSAAPLFLGERDRMRLQEEFDDRAAGRDAFAVVPAQQFDHRVAVLDDSRVLFGRDLDVVVRAAGFDTGTPIDSGARSGVAAKMRLEQRAGVDHYPVDIGQQFALPERAYISAPGRLVEIAQPSFGQRCEVGRFIRFHSPLSRASSSVACRFDRLAEISKSKGDAQYELAASAHS